MNTIKFTSVNAIKKINLLLVAFLLINNTVQSQCNPGNSPTFQLSANQATLATNGYCSMQIGIVNASTNPPGGPVSYTYIAPGGVPTQSIFPNVPGTWTVQVRDNTNNCVTSQTVPLTVLQAPTLSVAASNTLICRENNAILTASGASNYTWNTNATTAVITVTPLYTSTFSVIATGSNVCAITASVVINVVLLPKITVTASQPTFCANQSIELTAHGADTYSWSTSQTGSSITVAPPATALYTVYGTDKNGCEGIRQFWLTVSPCTNIEENKIDEFRIYPVPAGDFLKLNIDDNAVAGPSYSIRIINAFGMCLREEQIEIKTNTNEIITTDFPAGIYFLKLYGENTEITKRFVINR